MGNLTEVALAIKGNDRKKAARMLTEIIKEDPSAEDYYLAALLSKDKDKDKARALCKRALNFDSRHRKANQLWIELGGKPLQSPSSESPILERILGFFQDFGTNIPGIGPVLNRMHPNVRAGLFAALLIMLIAINLIMLMQFLGGSTASANENVVQVLPTVDATATPIPAPDYDEVYVSAGVIQAYFEENGYSLRPIANYIGESAPLQFQVMSVPYDLYLLIYDSVEAASSDQYRDMYGSTYVADGYGNARVYFPVNVDDETVEAIVDLVADIALVAPTVNVEEANPA